LAYGEEFLQMIFVTQHVIRGFLWGNGSGGWAFTGIMFLFRDLAVPADSAQIYINVVKAAWVTKGLFGALSDTIYVGGQKRNPLMMFVTAMAGISFFLIGYGILSDERLITLALFCCCLQAVVCDLMMEAETSIKVKDLPSQGPHLLTYVTGGTHVMNVLSFVTIGIIIQELGALYLYWFAVPIAFSVAYPIGMNWIGEESEENLPCCSVETSRVTTESRVVMFSGCLAACVILISVLALYDNNPLSLLIVAGVVAVFVVAGLFYSLDACVAKAFTFLFLQFMCNISTEGACFYFFTDDADMYPAGPHFSDLFYSTVLGLCAALASAVGVLLYNRFMMKWTYRSIFLVCNVFAMGIGLFNVVLYSRKNVEFGIPDEAFVLAGEAAAKLMAAGSTLPMFLLASQLTPPGLEATVWGVVAGVAALGTVIGTCLGAFLLDVYGVTPNGSPNEGAQFDNMWLVTLISAFGPLVPLLFLRALIPDAKQTDKLTWTGGGSVIVVTAVPQEESDSDDESRSFPYSRTAIPTGC
jgi:hypothetical protein